MAQGPSLKWRIAQARDNIVYGIKLVVKTISPLAGSLILAVAGKPVNKEDHPKRVLVLFAGGAGDVVMRSVVCGYLHHYFQNRDIYYLMPHDIALPYAKKTIRFDYKKSKVDPRYYARLVNELRAIGFGEAIVLLPTWEGFLVSLGRDVKPDRLFCYTQTIPKGLSGILSSMLRWLRPLGKRSVDVPLLSGLDKDWSKPYWPSEVFLMARFISNVINIMQPDLTRNEYGLLPFPGVRTEVLVDPNEERDYLAEMGARYGVDMGNCVLIGLGSSTSTRNWPPERFAEVAKYLAEKGMRIGILDHPKDAVLVERFAAAYGGDFLNLGAHANLRQVCILIKHAALTLCNDTSFVHLAVALAAPCVCISRNHNVGAGSCYGYEDIDQWVFGDAIETIEADAVKKTVQHIISHLAKNGSVSKREFTLSYFEQYT